VSATNTLDSLLYTAGHKYGLNNPPINLLSRSTYPYEGLLIPTPSLLRNPGILLAICLQLVACKLIWLLIMSIYAAIHGGLTLNFKCHNEFMILQLSYCLRFAKMSPSNHYSNLSVGKDSPLRQLINRMMQELIFMLIDFGDSSKLSFLMFTPMHLASGRTPFILFVDAT